MCANIGRKSKLKFCFWLVACTRQFHTGKFLLYPYFITSGFYYIRLLHSLLVKNARNSPLCLTNMGSNVDQIWAQTRRNSVLTSPKRSPERAEEIFDGPRARILRFWWVFDENLIKNEISGITRELLRNYLELLRNYW